MSVFSAISPEESGLDLNRYLNSPNFKQEEYGFDEIDPKPLDASSHREQKTAAIFRFCDATSSQHEIIHDQRKLSKDRGNYSQS